VTLLNYKLERDRDVGRMLFFILNVPQFSPVTSFPNINLFSHRKRSVDFIVIEKSQISKHEVPQMLPITGESLDLLHRIFLSLFLVAPTLEHRAFVKRFVSLQLLNPKTVGRTPWTGDQPVTTLLSTDDNTNRKNADIHALSGIRTHNPAFE
jgi:hypothetical protein